MKYNNFSSSLTNQIELPDTFIANSLKSLRQMRPVDTRSLQLNIENLNDEIPFCYLSYQTK